MNKNAGKNKINMADRVRSASGTDKNFPLYIAFFFQYHQDR